MLLIFDIGNTDVVFGCFSGDELLFNLRVKSDLRRTTDEYTVYINSLLEKRTDLKFTKAIISSVVPPLTSVFKKIIKDNFNLDPIVVGPGIKTGLSIKTKDPNAVGADRVVNSIAAKELFGVPSLVVDFGTATSFDYIDRDSNYCGGAIVPGIEISLNALVKNTAKLPKIELQYPEKAIGNDTVSAMQSGSLLGYTCLVDGLIEKFQEEVGEIKHIVATGGLGRIVAPKSKYITSYNEDLTLIGMKIISDLNQ
ncbi:UNVERIFIED_CONTAM: hypothetical protein GTU68_043448 [Idotea baltica]|nr:hypothetical protein [Idotea baltica]